MENCNVNDLITKAKKFQDNAYVPYSMLPIGACVLTKKGYVYGGCNVENVNMSSGIDAGKLAVMKAVSEGDTEIVALCVYADTSDLPFPSGDCLQTLREFTKKVQIIVANHLTHEEFSLFELLPNTFENND